MLSTDKQTDKQTDRQTDKLTNATKNITSFAKELINVFSVLRYQPTWTISLQSLQVLDLTRSLVGIADAKHFCKTLQAVQKLILRNIQSVSQDRRYMPSVTLSDFICIGNVRYLDLSYNDLVTIILGEMCWDTKLQVLILDHNMIANVYSSSGITELLAYLEAAQQLKILDVNYCSTTSYHKGLWDDDDNRTSFTGLENNENIHHYTSALNELIPRTPLSLFAGYGHWLQNMMKHCGNIHYLQVAKCVEYDEVCAFFSCVAPAFNRKACLDDFSGLAYERFSRQFCDFSECFYSIQLPLPHSLTQISLREFGKFVNERSFSFFGHLDTLILCLDPNNNLEVFDLTNAILNDLSSHIGKYVIHGLKKLKFFSVQGCHIPYVFNPLLFSDMESLEEIHIGGNRLFENDSLPAVMFQYNIKLSGLNLSYSHLQQIECNVFINNKHLAVLDLSHNHLDASSLAVLNPSNNNITHLNLSFSALTTLPATLRCHFDQFHDLVLDLSGNNFLCNCQHLDFLQWIQLQSNTAIAFVYAGDHVCSDSLGSTIHTIEVDSLYCNWYWEQPTIAVGCSVTALLVIHFYFYHLPETLVH